MRLGLSVEWIGYLERRSSGDKPWREKLKDFLNKFGELYSMEEVSLFRTGRNSLAEEIIDDYMKRRKQEELINMWIED